MANTKKDTKETKKKVNSKTTSAKKTTSTKKTVPKKTAATKKATTKKVTPKKEVVESVKEKEKVTTEKDYKGLKIILLILILIIFFIIIFMLSNKAGKGEYSESSTGSDATTYEQYDVDKESSSITEDQMGELISIDIDEYLELLDGSEYSIIYIGRPTCSHCQVQLPIMKYMVKQFNLVINYLNTDEFDEDGYTKLQQSNSYFSEGWGTPLILVVKDGDIVDKLEGESSIESLTELFTKYNLIGE